MQTSNGLIEIHNIEQLSRIRANPCRTHRDVEALPMGQLMSRITVMIMIALQRYPFAAMSWHAT